MNKDNVLDLTNAQINFFEVEIRNEDEGGDSPSTLRSAYDSLQQAPNDVIADWCNDDTVTNDEQAEDFVCSVKNLMDKYGEDCLLDDLLPSPESYRVSVGGKDRYFDSVAEAKQFASDYFDKTGVVLGIEEVK
ncbi:MAG: hypothetical protein ACREGR_04960 [Minisyncoccia bacterium]